jgi:ABC-type transporter Mla subunit MlaD
MLETKAVIWSVALFFVLLLLILFLWQMWRTAKNMATALEELNKTLPEILANMQEITANINSASAMIKQEAEEFVVLSRKVRAFLGLLNGLEMTLLRGVRAPLAGTLKTAFGLLKGARVFLDVFLQKDKTCQRDGR